MIFLQGSRQQPRQAQRPGPLLEPRQGQVRAFATFQHPTHRTDNPAAAASAKTALHAVPVSMPEKLRQIGARSSDALHAPSLRVRDHDRDRRRDDDRDRYSSRDRCGASCSLLTGSYAPYAAAQLHAACPMCGPPTSVRLGSLLPSSSMAHTSLQITPAPPSACADGLHPVPRPAAVGGLKAVSHVQMCPHPVRAMLGDAPQAAAVSSRTTTLAVPLPLY